ncbi:MAG: ribonuclease [Patescibacteria group bacterium]|nr:ribonuclease [Patescibacteria group bacterium]
MDYPYFIGVDEVGRGPVAGPVYVCALYISEENLEKIIKEAEKLPLRDSKKLTEKMREKWFSKITEFADLGLLKYVVSKAPAKEIDEKGIAVCIKACVKNSVIKIGADKEKTKVLLDGGLSVGEDFIEESFIKGDENLPVISLASIVAKVLRDKEISLLGEKYPEYHFEKHKGYGTKAHMDAILKHGLTEFHRKSFLKNYI